MHVPFGKFIRLKVEEFSKQKYKRKPIDLAANSAIIIVVQMQFNDARKAVLKINDTVSIKFFSI